MENSRILSYEEIRKYRPYSQKDVDDFVKRRLQYVNMSLIYDYENGAFRDKKSYGFLKLKKRETKPYKYYSYWELFPIDEKYGYYTKRKWRVDVCERLKEVAKEKWNITYSVEDVSILSINGVEISIKFEAKNNDA